MLYVVKDDFLALKNANRRIQESKNNKELYKNEKSLKTTLCVRIKRKMKKEKEVLSTVNKLIEIIDTNKDIMTDLQFYIIVNQLQYIEKDFLTFLTVRKLKNLCKKEITIDMIYNLASNLPTEEIEQEEFFSCFFVPNDKIDILNLEQGIRDIIKTNRLKIFFRRKETAMAQGYYPGHQEYQQVMIKVKKKNPICLYNYLKNLDDSQYDLLKHVFNCQIIDWLPNDYEILNLDEIEFTFYFNNGKEHGNIDDDLIYTKYNNDKNHYEYLKKYENDDDFTEKDRIDLEETKKEYENSKKEFEKMLLKYRKIWGVVK